MTWRSGSSERLNDRAAAVARRTDSVATLRYDAWLSDHRLGRLVVSSIEEIISTVQQAQNMVNQAIAATGAAIERTGQMQGQMAAAGVRDKVQQLAVAKDAIEKYRAYLGGSNEPANQAINLVKAVDG